MPMMIPPGEAVTVAVAPGQQVAAPGPAPAPAPRPVQRPFPRSPFKQEPSPDLVIMPHLSEPAQPEPQNPSQGT